MCLSHESIKRSVYQLLLLVFCGYMGLYVFTGRGNMLHDVSWFLCLKICHTDVCTCYDCDEWHFVHQITPRQPKVLFIFLTDVRHMQ